MGTDPGYLRRAVVVGDQILGEFEDQPAGSEDETARMITGAEARGFLKAIEMLDKAGQDYLDWHKTYRQSTRMKNGQPSAKSCADYLRDKITT